MWVSLSPSSDPTVLEGGDNSMNGGIQVPSDVGFCSVVVIMFA